MEGSQQESGAEVPADWRRIKADGVGPFETRVVYLLPDGSQRTLESRRVRKGSGVLDGPARHRRRWVVWAPRYLSWWLSVLFMVGSALFAGGAVTAILAGPLGKLAADALLFAGAALFTAGVYAQLLESINGQSHLGGTDPGPSRLRWFAWLPRRLSWWVALSYLVGALLFNVETTLALVEALGGIEMHPLLAYCSVLGSALFVVGGWLQVTEVCHRLLCLAVRDISWWSAMPILLGCFGFLVGALLGRNVLGLASFEEPLMVNLSYLGGSLLFLAGSYVMLPELFSE